MALIVLVTGILLAGIVHSGFNRQMDPKGCIMTFMQPSYYRLLGLGPEQTKLASKYSLLLYRDEYDYLPQVEHGHLIQTSDNAWSIDKDAKLRPTGVPALFIPGNAGSAKQVRSMAKEASKYYYQTLGGGNHDSEKPSSRPIDFYSDTIVTVATPHAVPPVALDYEATHIYDTITSFWTKGYSGEGAMLRNVTLVSIMGGTLDTTVNGDSANIHSIIPQSHGFTVFTSNIPHAWVGCDHLSILWRLLRGAEKKGPEDIQTIDLDDVPHTFVEAEGSWTFPPADDISRSESVVPHLFLLPLSDQPRLGYDTMSVLTDHGLGQQSRLDLLLCKDAEENLKQKTLLCSSSDLHIFPVPASTDTSSLPLFTGEYFTAREFRSVSLSLEMVPDYKYLAILDRGRRFSDAGFLVAQPVNMSTTVKTVQSSMLAKPLFSTMMKQSSWNLHEDRYFVNIGAKSSAIDINFHGDSPYHVKTSHPGKRGIELQFWTDLSCPEALSLDLHVDLYGSLGRVLIRYRMVVLVFTYMVVVLTIQSQFWNWRQDGSFQSFGNTLRQLITSPRYWKVSSALAVMAFSQSMQQKTYVDLGSDNEQEADTWPSWTSDWRTDILRDVSLGGNATFFWFLAPLFLQMAVGIMVLIWLVLNNLVQLLAGALALTMRSSRSKDSGVLTPQRSVKSMVVSILVQFAFVATIVPHHFAFVVTVLRILFLCAKELNVAKGLSSSSSGTHSQRAASWNRFHYMSSILVLLFTLVPFAVPGLMAFVRNILVHWHEPFSTDHHVYHVAPFVIFVETLARGATIPVPSLGAEEIHGGIVVVLSLFSVRYTWLIYTVSWFWVSWQLLLQLWDTCRSEREKPKHE
ncbi:GPI inositol deacylase [Podila clonocystis]|nr:GPI inositol deacylase [Podila clonocystis]